MESSQSLKVSVPQPDDAASNLYDELPVPTPIVIVPSESSLPENQSNLYLEEPLQPDSKEEAVAPGSRKSSPSLSEEHLANHLIFKSPNEFHMTFPLVRHDGLGPSPLVRFSGIKRTIADPDALYMCYQERNRSEVSRMFVKGVTLNGIQSYKIIVHFVFDRKITYMNALRAWPEKTDTTFLFKEQFLSALKHTQYSMPSVSKTQYFDKQFHAIIVVKEEELPFPEERELALLKILLQVSMLKATQDYSSILMGGLKLILP